MIDSYLECDQCGSKNIIETEEGYACRDCGIVLELQRIKNYLPFDEKQLQNAPLCSTQIGFRQERMRSPRVLQFNRMVKLNTIKRSEERAMKIAEKEISRILEALQINFNERKKRNILEHVMKIRQNIRKGTKYRNLEKLVPIILHVYCKLHNISVNSKELLEISNITKNEFISFLRQIHYYFPRYQSRNRQKYIAQKILEVTEHFKLGMNFYYQAMRLMKILWNSIKCTKDDVIAGIVCSITALCNYRDCVKVKYICDKLNIRMSTIQAQIKRNIFEKMKIDGFTSLIQSADLLKKVMNEAGYLNVHEK